METFGDWLLRSLENRGWSASELARRANLGPATVSRIISGTRQAGPDVALAIARALGESPETVMRRAGLLPSLPPPIAEEREIVSILRTLPAAIRRTVVTMIRALAGQEPGPAAVGEPQENYIIDDTLTAELLAEFDKVPEEWKQEAVRQVMFVARMATRPPVRIIGEDDVVEKQREEPES